MPFDVYCPHCWGLISSDDTTCTQCGEAVKAAPRQEAFWAQLDAMVAQDKPKKRGATHAKH